MNALNALRPHRRTLTHRLLLCGVLMVPLPVLAADAPTAEQAFGLPEQLAAEIASLLCEDSQYLSCTTRTEGRCMLEMGLVAGKCARSLADGTAKLKPAALASELTSCLLQDHATLIDFDATGLARCLSDNGP